MFPDHACTQMQTTNIDGYVATIGSVAEIKGKALFLRRPWLHD